MTTHYDVIVVGGGIVGASAAYHLVRNKAKTLLIDRQDAGRATSAGAGILAPEISARDDDWFNFAVQAVDYYPTLLSMLTRDGATETGYDRCGMLTVAVSEDELQPFKSAVEVIFARQKERGKPSSDSLYPVSASEAKALFPPLANVLDAIYYRDAARVDGRLIEAALRTASATHGLETLKASVGSLSLSDGNANGVHISDKNGAQQLLSADAVLITGGAWSPAFGHQLDLEIPIEPQRGQIAHLDLPGQRTGEWPIVQGFRGHYMVCWPGKEQDGEVTGRVVVGATRETGSGYQPVTSVEGVMETLGEALRVAPGLAQASIHEVRVGLRPVTDDGLPLLGKVPSVDNVFLAAGHGPTGLQLGPYSGKLMADLISGKKLETDLTPFQVDRF